MLLSLFGIRSHLSTGIDDYGSLVGSIADAVSPDDLTHHSEVLRHTASFVSSKEAEWASTIQSGIVGVYHDLAPRWAPDLTDSERRLRTADLLRSELALEHCAAMYARSVLLLHGLSVSAKELTTAAQRCTHDYPVPLRLYNEILARIILAPEMSLAKRANWLWDIQLAFAVSTRLAKQGTPVWIVTSDEDIIDASVRAGASRLVRSLTDYEALVHKGTDAVVDAVEDSAAA
ncbi:MAG: hypothetical protein IPF98_17030 [Gemmatimonadetes bacterium]|nr:hypothetical protein [Gemmatimonadota bacterium]